MPEVTIKLTKPDGKFTRLLLDLHDTPLAKAVVAALQQLGLEALQVKWSGNGFYIVLGEGFTMPDMEGVETDCEFVQGDVLVYPELRKLVVAYGDVKMYDGSVDLDCYRVGGVTKDHLEDLLFVGNDIQRYGLRTVGVVD